MFHRPLCLLDVNASFFSLSGGFMPSQHLRPSSGREHTIVELIQSGDDDDYSINETRRKSTTGRQSPSLCDKWHRIFYMPSRTGTAGHTKAFDNPVAEHWGKAEMFSSCGTRTDNISGQSRMRVSASLVSHIVIHAKVICG